MPKSLSRRDFIKLAGLLPLNFAALPGGLPQIGDPSAARQNVLVLVFDAWSAANISVYGYPRRTTPNLERLAGKAIVYHNHYAGSHYTSPGTASLLTGTTPWTHQAFNFNATVVDSLATGSIFHAFPNHYRLAYSHNPLVNTLLRQFSPAIDSFTSWNRLYLENTASLVDLFQNDIDTAIIGRNRALKLGEDGFSYTLFLSRLYEIAIQKKIIGMKARFPRGVTNNDGFDYYLLEEGLDWLSENLKAAPQPFLGYYHFYPPHDPYNTRSDFYDAFLSDGYHPTPKPVHFLQKDQPIKNLREFRRWYDEFILYVDAEFNRLYTDLERSGILENTWLILTSDHGELFERSILGHTEPVFYQPVFQIPLLIFPPGQESRVDVFTNTSTIDLLPTLCHLLGQVAPPWSEGMVMPPFAPAGPMDERELTSIQVSALQTDGTIDQATAVIILGQDKLIWYPGYQGLPGAGEGIELFNLSNDPEELNNRYPQENALANELLARLRHRLVKLQQSYA